MLRVVLGKAEICIDVDQCEIQEIFGTQITYGLFYNNEAVQTMSFNNVCKDSWELTQSIINNSISVAEGLPKLFNHFIRQHNPSKITAYCDFNKFDGRDYELLGMHFVGYTEPNVWYMLPNKDIVSEYTEAAVSKIYGTGYKIYAREN